MKKCNHIKKIIKEYWGLLLILGFFPVIINYIVLMPSFLPVVGDSEKWLSFFGAFAGSVIMAGVTLYVLDKQLQQNHKENMRNAILQIATLTNNEEKAQIDKLAEALVDFQTSFDYLTINQVAERMSQNQFLVSDVELLHSLTRDIDRKGFKVDILLKPIPQSKYIKEYNIIYNHLYNSYGLLIGDLIFFIDLMKDLPEDKEEAKQTILREIHNSKAIDAKMIPDIPGFKPKFIYEIIEENEFYEDIAPNASTIIGERLIKTVQEDTPLKEKLKATIIDLLDYEYRCINDNFNEKINEYE